MIDRPTYELREIALPDDVPGHLFAASMPGYYSRDFDSDRRAILESGIDTMVCLAPLNELFDKSPYYARALLDSTLKWHALHLPIDDFHIPEDRDDFLQVVRYVAGKLHNGDWVVVHCGAGVGRTGMFATVTLVALGLTLEAARARVKDAGSGAERASQKFFESLAVEQLRMLEDQSDQTDTGEDTETNSS